MLGFQYCTAKFLVTSLCFNVLLKAVTSQTSEHCDTLTSNTEAELTCDVTTFNVIYSPFPPYLHRSSPNDVTFEGVLAEVMGDVVASCCGNASTLCYVTETSRLESVEEEMTSLHHHLAFPVFKTSLTRPDDVTGYKFLPILETAGISMQTIDFQPCTFCKCFTFSNRITNPPLQ